MSAARTWKLGTALGALIVAAIVASALVARGPMGYTDWPAASGPAAEEMLVLAEDAPPASTATSGASADPAGSPEAVPAPRATADPDPTIVAAGGEEGAPEKPGADQHPAPGPEPERQRAQPPPEDVAPEPPAAEAAGADKVEPRPPATA